MTRLRWSIIFLVLIFIATLFTLLRTAVQRHHIAQASTLAWFFIAAFLGLGALFPAPLLALMHWLGFEVPANGIFLISIGLLMFLNFLLTIENAKLRSKLFQLVQHMALDKAP